MAIDNSIERRCPKQKITLHGQLNNGIGYDKVVEIVERVAQEIVDRELEYKQRVEIVDCRGVLNKENSWIESDIGYQDIYEYIKQGKIVKLRIKNPNYEYADVYKYADIISFNSEFGVISFCLLFENVYYEILMYEESSDINISFIEFS